MKFKCLHLTSQLHLAGFLNSWALGLSGSLLCHGNSILRACLSITCSSGSHEHKCYTIIAVKRGRHKYFKSWEVFCDAESISYITLRDSQTSPSLPDFLSFLRWRKSRNNCSLWTSDLKERRESEVCVHMHGWRWLIHIQRHISMLSFLFFNNLSCQEVKKLFLCFLFFPTLALYSFLQDKIR